MRPVITAVLAAAALAACGGAAQEQPKATATAGGDEGAIRATLARYQAAVRANDAKTICTRLMSRELRDFVERSKLACEEIFGGQIAKGGPKYAIAVKSIEITGDRAVVKSRAVERDGPRTSTQPLVREGGRWLLTK
jgi:hypothetical protein